MISNNNKLVVSIVSLMMIEISIFIHIDSQIDKNIIKFAFFAQTLGIYGIVKNNGYLKELSHVCFGTALLLILGFSQTHYLNILNMLILFWTILSRKLYNGCLFYDCTGENIEIIPDGPNFDFIFTTLFLLQLLKIIISVK